MNVSFHTIHTDPTAICYLNEVFAMHVCFVKTLLKTCLCFYMTMKSGSTSRNVAVNRVSLIPD